jgi:RNA polymerase sigma factor (sigma-70 family)
MRILQPQRSGLKQKRPSPKARPEGEIIMKRAALRLTPREAAHLRRLEKQPKKKLEKAEADFLSGIYSRFSQRSQEIAELLETGERVELRRELVRVKETRARAALLIHRATPLRISAKEAASIRKLEKENAAKHRPPSREDELSLFKIYSRFSEKSALLRAVLDVWSADDRKDNIRKELAYIENTRSRLGWSLVLAHQGLTWRIARGIAKRYRIRSIHIQDLAQEGAMGLFEAVGRFDHRRGFQFSTYGGWWVRQAITRAIATNSRMVRIPEQTNNALTVITRCVREYLARNNKEPTIKEISERTGCPQATVERVLDLRPNSELCKLSRNLPDQDSKEAFEAAAARVLREAVPELLQNLTAREREIIRRRYGIGREDWEGETLEAVGDDLGITRERVRQIQARALKKLLPRARSMRMDDY